MNLELLAKLYVPLTTALIAATFQLPGVSKALDDLRHIKRDRRKRECEFAWQFAERCADPDVKRYAEEFGYAALVGDGHLTTDERKLLLSFPDSERTISKYLRTYQWVSLQLEERRLQWKRRRHESSRYRAFAKSGYFVGYLGWALFAGLPFMAMDLPPMKDIPSAMFWALLLWTLSTGGPMAIYCMRRIFVLAEAEELMAQQWSQQAISQVAIHHQKERRPSVRSIQAARRHNDEPSAIRCGFLLAMLLKQWRCWTRVGFVMAAASLSGHRHLGEPATRAVEAACAACCG